MSKNSDDVMQDIRIQYPDVWNKLFPKGKPSVSENMTLRIYRNALNDKISVHDVVSASKCGSSSEVAMVAHVLNVCGYKGAANQINDDPYWSITYFDSYQTKILCKLLCYWDGLKPFSTEEKKIMNLDQYKVS